MLPATGAVLITAGVGAIGFGITGDDVLLADRDREQLDAAVARLAIVREDFGQLDEI